MQEAFIPSNSYKIPLKPPFLKGARFLPLKKGGEEGFLKNSSEKPPAMLVASVLQALPALLRPPGESLLD